MVVERLVKSESFMESEYLVCFLVMEACKRDLTAEQRKSIKHALLSNPRVNGSEKARIYIESKIIQGRSKSG